MAGIYIHIPFCKQACHYCDFHFSTNQSKKNDMLLALAKEIEMRKNELQKEPIETIYFGGGTPSLLSIVDLRLLIDAVYKNYKVVENPEITLEANPDDLTENKIIELSKTPINRLSIGIQSFFDDDLQLMNRAHNSAEAVKSLQIATHYFDTISIDLIYGIPEMTNEKWIQNIQKVLDFKIAHISCYALTVEPKTALKKLIATGKIAQPKDEIASEHFEILVDKLTQNGYIHYELSNFGKENYFSKNNSSYWLGKKYLGIGPSAHSFDGTKRSWNKANNSLYINIIKKNELPSEAEILSKTDLYNEYIMTGLRTIWGVSFDRIATHFGQNFLNYLEKQSQKFIDNELLINENGILKTTPKGKFLCDGIASDLFMVNLESR
jgi:oxygen-independent coproporphyrinogen III oxidase